MRWRYERLYAFALGARGVFLARALTRSAREGFPAVSRVFPLFPGLSRLLLLFSRIDTERVRGHQFNVVSRETLLRAQKDPSKYQNLIVRVAGYSAYFANLEKTVQQDIIERTEERLA